MYLKERYKKVFTYFIIFQFIILIFFIYFPISSQFNNFQDFYLRTQGEILQRILERKKADLTDKVVENAIWEDPAKELADGTYISRLTRLAQDPTEIDTVILMDTNREPIFLEPRRFRYPEFQDTEILRDALNNDYQSAIFQYGQEYFIVAVSPVVKSTQRFNPYGVLVLVQSFDQYFINQRVATFMDKDVSAEIITELAPVLEDNQIMVPVKSYNNAVIGSIIITYNNPFFNTFRHLFLRNMAIGILLLFIFFTFVSKLISNRFAKRIELLYKEVENAVSHNFAYEIQVPGHDEVSGLANAFNDMAKTMNGHLVQIYETNEKLHDTYLEIIQGLITAIEVKDPYTRGHSHRVMIYSEIIAKKMRYPDIEMIKMAALLHDIGKIGVPETILNKAGKLTNEEFEVVKAHPDHGYRILSNIEGFNRVKDIIRFHHERIDGKGYPCGMKDIVIPLESRIIAVADTFDAITSDRAYRKGMTAEEAITELQRVKGQQLDAMIVDTFVEIATEHNNFKDLLTTHQGVPQANFFGFGEAAPTTE